MPARTIDQESFLRPALNAIRSNFALAIFVIMVALLPLYRTALLEDSFNTPKLLLLQALTILGFVALLVQGFAQRRAPNSATNLAGACLANPVTIAITLYVALHGISAVYAESGALALRGTIFWVTLLAVHLFASAVLVLPGAVWAVLGATISSAAITAAWTILEDATKGTLFGGIMPRLPDWRGYLSAGLGNSGHICGMIGMAMPAFIGLILLRRRFPILGLLALFVCFLAVVVTWSVGSTTSLLLGVGTAAIVCLSQRRVMKLHWLRAVAIILVGIAAIAFYNIPHPLNPHAPSLVSEAFSSQRWQDGWPTRVAIYQTTLHMITESPWIGVGANNFTLAYVQQIVPSLHADPALRIYAGSYTNDAHNDVLHTWAELGLVGVISFFAILTAFATQIVQVLRNKTVSPTTRLAAIASAGAVVVILADGIMSFPLRLVSHAGLFIVLLAIPTAILRQSQSSESPTTPAPCTRLRRQQLAIAVALTLLLPCAYLHTQRVIAERLLKQARILADEQLPPPERGGAPFMQLEAAHQEAVARLSQSGPAPAEPIFAAVATAAQSARMREVEQLLRRALESDPRYSNASSRLGMLLLMQRRYDDALGVLSQTARDLQSGEILERLGLARYYLGNTTAAIQEWTTAAQRRPAAKDYFDALATAAKAQPVPPATPRP